MVCADSRRTRQSLRIDLDRDFGAYTLGAGKDPFEGEIAAFRMYESVLSDAEAQANYDATRLVVAAYDATSVAGAAVTVNADGGFTYDPGSLFNSLAAGDRIVARMDCEVNRDAEVTRLIKVPLDGEDARVRATTFN